VALAVERRRDESEHILLPQLLDDFGEHRIQIIVQADFVERATGLERDTFEVAARTLGVQRVTNPHRQPVHDHVALGGGGIHVGHRHAIRPRVE
jgi:hypothetical protein